MSTSDYPARPFGGPTAEQLGEIARRTAIHRQVADLFTQWRLDPAVAPTNNSQRFTLELDMRALQAAGDFEALELSVLVPFGAVSVLAHEPQARALALGYDTELVWDPRVPLALECARRQRDGEIHPRIATVARTLRGQLPGEMPDSPRQFHYLTLAESRKTLPHDGFEVAAVAGQIGVFDSFLDMCQPLGPARTQRHVIIQATETTLVMAQRVDHAIAKALPHMRRSHEALEQAPFSGLRLSYGADVTDSVFQEVASVGLFDWVARVSADPRDHLVAGQLDLDAVIRWFGPS
jgi:hypothetical protein